MSELWTIAGSWPHFEIETTSGPDWNFLHQANDAVLNGTYATRIEALESLIGSLEHTRKELSGQIAKHKRALRQAQGIEAATAAETVELGSVHESPVGDSRCAPTAPKGAI